MALLDFLSSEFTKHQVTRFCSVWIEGIVVVEGGAQGKGIVMGCLNAQQNWIDTVSFPDTCLGL